jgi:hypothetical protein
MNINVLAESSVVVWKSPCFYKKRLLYLLIVVLIPIHRFDTLEVPGDILIYFDVDNFGDS